MEMLKEEVLILLTEIESKFSNGFSYKNYKINGPVSLKLDNIEQRFWYISESETDKRLIYFSFIEVLKFIERHDLAEIFFKYAGEVEMLTKDKKIPRVAVDNLVGWLWKIQKNQYDGQLEVSYTGPSNEKWDLNETYSEYIDDRDKDWETVLKGTDITLIRVAGAGVVVFNTSFKR